MAWGAFTLSEKTACFRQDKEHNNSIFLFSHNDILEKRLEYMVQFLIEESQMASCPILASCKRLLQRLALQSAAGLLTFLILLPVALGQHIIF